MYTDIITSLIKYNVIVDDDPIRINPRYPAILEKSDTLKSDIIEATNHLSCNDMKERLLCILTNVQIQPLCPVCGNVLKIHTTGKNRGTFPRTCSRKCSHIDPIRLSNIKQTNLAKYGVDNPRKNSIVKQKIIGAKILKYGDAANIKKVATTKLIRYGNAKYNNREQAKLTNLKKYGESNFSSIVLSDVAKETLHNKDNLLVALTTFGSQQAVANSINVDKSTVSYWCSMHDIDSPAKGSSYELKVQQLLTNLDVSYSINNKSILSNGQELDIVCDYAKLAIEINGAYWHGEKYGKDRYYHLSKTNMAADVGYTLLHFWDYELEKSYDVCADIIKSKLGLLNRKIYARKCRIVEVNVKDAEEFISRNHLQPIMPKGTKITYGLMYQNSLVCCMVFCKSRYSNVAEWEILRIASKLDTSVIGGVGRLYKHFVKFNCPKSVMSYSDKRYSTGNVYEQIGMKLHNISKPGYVYHKHGKIYNRLKFQKHKLDGLLSDYDPNISASANMRNHGYDRIWDCGQLCYVQYFQ